MPRIRTIKPEFFTSLTIADLSPEQRLTFIGLWTHVDDEGRCVDDARLIKAAIWPLDDRTAADVETDLGALSESSLILRYTLNRKRYLAVSGWSEHQKINRPTPSRLPAPEQGEYVPAGPVTSTDSTSPSPHAQLNEDSRPERKGKERNREQGKESTADAASTIAIPARHDVERICRTLADAIEANGSRRPTITQKWRDEARLMLDKDERPLDDVLAAIHWCQAHNFWRSVVLSVPKLREKYDAMRLQAQPSTGLAATGTTSARPSTTDARVQQALDLAARYEAMEAQQ